MPAEVPPPAHVQVVLLHGLCRTPRSMRPMQRFLEAAGYRVLNVGYPSRMADIGTLGEEVIGGTLEHCRATGATEVHFVCHSLGGILVREYAAKHPDAPIGHVVMLGPPNAGSEVVDRLGHLRLFTWINGPAGAQLGTGEASTPKQLGSLPFHTGIIAGNRSINWINSLMIPGPDDGKVSVASTRLEGMADHLVLPTSHPFLMTNREAMRQTAIFLQQGRFEH
ncbi:MAG: alpha/beta fold hydrolase [Luteolibacter sp.]